MELAMRIFSLSLKLIYLEVIDNFQNASKFQAYSS